MKHVKKKYDLKVYSVISALFIMLTSCSGGFPSESDAKNIFQKEHFDAIKEGSMKLDSFKKSNGKKMNLYGVETYIVEYKATVTYPKGVLPECAGNGDNWPSDIYWKCFNAGVMGVASKQPGQKETINGEYIFAKTEKGWQGQDGKLY